MKKLISLLLILIFIFSGCQSTEQTASAEPVGDCSFSMYDIYPEEGTVFCGYPDIFGNKIVFCAAHHISVPQQGSGNIHVYDID